MMSNVQLFENMPAAYKDLLAQLAPEKNLTGGEYSNNHRLSIRGGVFRKIVNGKEVAELESRAIKAVIIKAAPISRMYYKGTYTAGESNPPVCWSADTSKGFPSDDVVASDRQANKCGDCAQNIKGSGQGESRACRFQQRVALLLADENGKVVSSDVYQLSLPATSVFGDKQDKMAMQAYARLLDSHKSPVASVLTEIRFDTDASTPKLCFKPLRPLEEEELLMAIDLQKTEEVTKMLTLTVSKKSEEDGPAVEEPKALPPLFPEAEAVAAPVAAEEVIEEPTVKVSKKKADKPKEDEDLSNLLEEWDD
jgi:hypothetical protein